MSAAHSLMKEKDAVFPVPESPSISSMIRSALPLSSQRLDLGRIQVDTETMLVYKDGEPLDLTQREYELVKTLASSRGQALSRESLMKQVWNFDGFVGDVRAVDVAIRRLREKLEDDPADPKFIITRRGLGYAFGKSAEPA